MSIDYRKTLLQVAQNRNKGRQLPTLFDHPEFNEICKALIGGDSLATVAERFGVKKPTLGRFSSKYLRPRIKRAQQAAKKKLAEKFEEGVDWYYESNKKAVEHAEEMGDAERRDNLMKGAMRHAIDFLGRASGAFEGDGEGGTDQTNKGVVININKMFAVPHTGELFEFEDPAMAARFEGMTEEELAQRLLGSGAAPEEEDSTVDVDHELVEAEDV